MGLKTRFYAQPHRLRTISMPLAVGRPPLSIFEEGHILYHFPRLSTNLRGFEVDFRVLIWQASASKSES